MGVGTSRKVCVWGGGGQGNLDPALQTAQLPQEKMLVVLCSPVHGGSFGFLNFVIEGRMKILAKNNLEKWGSHGPPNLLVPTPMFKGARAHLDRPGWYDLERSVCV